MSYQEALDNIGKTTERALVSSYQRVVAGAMSMALFQDLAVTLIALGQAQGRMAAEVSFLAWLQATIGADALPVAAAPLPHYRDEKRLRKAIVTVTEKGDLDQAAVESQLGRLAFAETVESSQRAFGEAMEQSPHAESWVRGLEPKACELCVWWWRDGRVWPKSHSMPTHKGCTCTPIPSQEEAAAPVSKEGATASRIRNKQGTHEERQKSGYSQSKKDSRR